MEDSSSGTTSSAPAPAPTRNPYAACRPVSALSSSSSASSGHQQRSSTSRRRTLKDVNHQQQQDQQSSSSAATSTTSTRRTTKRVACPTPTSALQLFRSLQRQPRTTTTRTAARDDDDYSYSIHLLTDHCEWTRLDPGRIHELAGAAGTAKTQLALQACIDCAVQGYDCSYVSLKGGHSATVLARLAYRLNQMIPTTTATTSTTASAAAASQRHDILSRIHLRAIRNADELVNDLLHRTTTTSTKMMTLRLLVIDSVADVFRGDAGTDYPDRALRFLQWVTALRRMYHDCPILILNQVTWTDTQPALGMTWAHCVNASFLVVAAVQQNSSTNATTKQQQQPPQQRVLSLRRSPVHGPHSIAFVVETGGCVAVVVPPVVVARPQR
jgi:Rad51